MINFFKGRQTVAGGQKFAVRKVLSSSNKLFLNKAKKKFCSKSLKLGL